MAVTLCFFFQISNISLEALSNSNQSWIFNRYIQDFKKPRLQVWNNIYVFQW